MCEPMWTRSAPKIRASSSIRTSLPYEARPNASRPSASSHAMVDFEWGGGKSIAQGRAELIELLAREVGVHRKAEHTSGNFFSCREGTGRAAGERTRTVKRSVVGPRLDAGTS